MGKVNSIIFVAFKKYLKQLSLTINTLFPINKYL